MKEVVAPTPDFDSYIHRKDTKYIARGEDDLEALYDAGYLPYSSTKDLQGIFYSARSARVVLKEFALSSENRRIARKFDGQFEKRRIAIKDFGVTELFYTFVSEYFAKRHGAQVAPRERIELWMRSGLVSTVIEYRQGTKIIGYVLEVESGTSRHYWYSAYYLDLARQSLGLWLMLDCIRDAKESGMQYYYIGTLYGTKALYKTNFTPLEWWDGSSWSGDIPALKALSRSDSF